MVKKSKIGYYVIFRFDAPSNIVSKLERFYSLDEYILRFLTIRLDKDAIEQLEKNKTRSQSDVSEDDGLSKVVGIKVNEELDNN